MIVVDTNILLGAVGPSQSSPWVDGVLLRDAVWIAPVLWRSEFRNALAGYVRNNNLPVPRAIEMTSEAEALLHSEVSPRDEIVFRHLHASRCTAYDLEFVALAEEYALVLVTLDKQLLREFPQLGIHPQAFAEGGRDT